jgi:hypothetical protein
LEDDGVFLFPVFFSEVVSVASRFMAERRGVGFPVDPELFKKKRRRKKGGGKKGKRG